MFFKGLSKRCLWCLNLYEFLYEILTLILNALTLLGRSLFVFHFVLICLCFLF